MNKKILRSAAAITAGAVAMIVGSSIVTTAVSAFGSETFRPGSQYSVGWLLVFLSASSVGSVIGGFVTGVIAQRNEIKHAIGLVLFTLLISLCFMGGYRSAARVPSWYTATCYISSVPLVLLGAWLRMKQGALLRKMPAGVTQTANNLWLSIMMSVDPFRFPVAIGISVITFLGGGYLTMLLGGVCLLGIRKLSGQDHLVAQLVLVWVVVSFVLSFLLARRVFRKIMVVDTSLIKGTR